MSRISLELIGGTRWAIRSEKNRYCPEQKKTARRSPCCFDKGLILRLPGDASSAFDVFEIKGFEPPTGIGRIEDELRSDRV